MNTNQAAHDLQPFFFGEASSQLYGCYHPEQMAKRNIAIVICSPLGDEAIRMHRACKQLALRLSQSGFPTLRFDYFGTGDSAGDDYEATLSRWREDIGLALEAARQRSGAGRVGLVGLRLGAALALEAAGQCQDCPGVVLWEPIMSGTDYLNDLAEAHQTRLNYFLSDPAAEAGSPEASTELLGFAFSTAMVQQMQQVDMLELSDLESVSDILLIQHIATDAASQLTGHLHEQGIRVSYECIDDPLLWREDPDKALIPGQTLKAIRDWWGEKFD